MVQIPSHAAEHIHWLYCEYGACSQCTDCYPSMLQDRFADFTNIWHSFASMFSYMLAMFDYNGE